MGCAIDGEQVQASSVAQREKSTAVGSAAAGGGRTVSPLLQVESDEHVNAAFFCFQLARPPKLSRKLS